MCLEIELSNNTKSEAASSNHSRIEGFRHLSVNERRAKVSEACGLSTNSQSLLQGQGALPMNVADGMIENVIGTFELPIGVATNFLINDRDYLIPMVVEEPSVVAAASYMARIARSCGGFKTSSCQPIMRGQIQILGLKDPFAARLALLQSRDDIIALANKRDDILIGLGGGCKDIDVHIFESTASGPMVVLHLLVDVRDAMGANTVNTMAEAVAPLLETITGGTVRLRILSNLADLRLARASVTLTPASLATDAFSGERIIAGIVEACSLAIIDPYRAATHNKGIMNGIDPIVIATGNDWRAIEAGAHAYASRAGSYTTLTRWEQDNNGDLRGTIELPMALGLVGGATKTHPAAQASLEILKVQSAQELAEVTVAVGLAQNLGALRALSTEGIQRGHMALHARNIAIMAGAVGKEVQVVAIELSNANDVRLENAQAALKRLRENQ